MIEVWSHRHAVFFRVAFLGPIVLTGTLTTEWSGDPFRAIYERARRLAKLKGRTWDARKAP